MHYGLSMAHENGQFCLQTLGISFLFVGKVKFNWERERKKGYYRWERSPNCFRGEKSQVLDTHLMLAWKRRWRWYHSTENLAASGAAMATAMTRKNPRRDFLPRKSADYSRSSSADLSVSSRLHFDCCEKIDCLLRDYKYRNAWVLAAQLKLCEYQL